MTGTLTPGHPADTIFALASGPGRAAIAVIRLSGTITGAILGGLCGLPAPRHASLRKLRARDGSVLDQALVLWMPGPASYTGEDCAELHVHGGRAVIRAVTAALLHGGARPADAGEFTRRAFLAGRMDLLEAEAIADLSASETESQRILALRQVQGAASRRIAGWSERLTRCLAFQEALIDFPDEALPDSVEAGLTADLATLLAEIRADIGAAPAGERVRSGLHFVITGPPNAGKSSLFNALAGRDVAIVSPWPGTTRDTLEIQLDLGGVAVTLVDTAGLRSTTDDVEAEGVRRALSYAEQADLVLHLAEAGDTEPVSGTPLLISSKCDLAPAPPGWLGISTRTGEGLGELLAVLARRAAGLVASEREPILTNARHVAALRDAEAALSAALQTDLPELRGEELRLARAALGRLTGRLDTEGLLDVVFGAFCIGK